MACTPGWGGARAAARGSPRPSQGGPPGIELVVREVPEPPAGDDLAQGGRTFEASRAERLAQPGLVVGGWCLEDRIVAQRRDGAAHEDDALVHRVGERLTRVAADDDPPLLHHEPRHVA